MSFLPYSKPSTAAWAMSVTGSSALHFGLFALLLTSSVAFLPVPIHNETRAPDFEVTLEILDADLIDLTDPAPEDQLVPPDAVALAPDDAEANLLEEFNDAILTPETDTALAPVDLGLVPLEEATNDLLRPNEVDQIIAEELTVVEAAAAEAETALDAMQPSAPASIPDTGIISIDDISPIDDAEISPLAEPVAPANITEPVVVTLAPDVVADEQITALVLPEEPTPIPDAPKPTLPIVVAPDVTAEPDITELTAVLPEEDPAPDPPATVANPNPPQVVDNPDVTTTIIGTLIQRIRAMPSAQCSLALPRRAGPDGVGVSFIGGQEADLDAAAVRLLDGLSPVPVQTREIIDQRQCALLDAVRQIADYPAGRIGLALDDTTLRSGENLRGRVVGAGGLFVTLLLIDDNGVVQDLSRFTTLDGNEPVIDAPVARAGPARATRQIILALGSNSGPIDVSGQIGQEAEDVFFALSPDVLKNAVFGLATFDVR